MRHVNQMNWCIKPESKTFKIVLHKTQPRKTDWTDTSMIR